MAAVIAVLITFVFVVALAALGISVFLYFHINKQLNDSSTSAQKSVDNVNLLLQEFAKDVDKKLLYYLHDANQVLTLTADGFAVNGSPYSSIAMGTSSILYDPVAQTLALSNSPTGSKVLLTNDYVDLAANGNKVKVGQHTLYSNGANLQLCNALGSCKTL